VHEETKVMHTAETIDNGIVVTTTEDVKIQNEEEFIKNEKAEIVDLKYGDQKIDISEIKDNLNDIPQTNHDPSRPQNLGVPNANEPLPSYSNRVGMEEFSVGHFREYQLRDDLANLIEKYNK
jgi:hypothetical protein